MFCTNKREKVSEPVFLFQLLKQVATVQYLGNDTQRRTLFLPFCICEIALVLKEVAKSLQARSSDLNCASYNCVLCCLWTISGLLLTMFVCFSAFYCYGGFYLRFEHILNHRKISRKNLVRPLYLNRTTQKKLCEIAYFAFL